VHLPEKAAVLCWLKLPCAILLLAALCQRFAEVSVGFCHTRHVQNSELCCDNLLPLLPPTGGGQYRPAAQLYTLLLLVLLPLFLLLVLLVLLLRASPFH